MTDILHALRESLNNLLVDQSGKISTAKGSVCDQNIIKCAGLALLNEFGSTGRLWLDYSCDFAQ
jgi:hypothetical protein